MNARGIDISRYNVSFDPTKATTQIDFIVQKATEGISYVDLAYETLWSGVQQVPIRGAYHYQRSEMSWLAQAEHFLNTQAKHDYHILALDLEGYGNLYSDTFFADTKRIIDHWRQYAPKQKIILYTNLDGYKQLYYSLIRSYGSGIVSWLDGVPLWLASPGAAGSVPLPPYRKTWEIHQYSWNGVPSLYGMGGTRVDENVYNGTVEQMSAWLGLSGTIIPPDVGGEMKAGVILAGLNIRTGPGVSYADIGDLKFGDAVFGDLDTVSNWFHFNKIIRKTGVVEIVDGWASATSPAYMTIVDIPTSSDPNNPNTVESTDVWKDNLGNVLATYKGTLSRQ